ncbi:MFS general substrate transporter [Cryphonectria parasitica EP155]|uniref:MFS general substrate transporter n=1 Tax=Cryphonectria parasitica (strain ATCC 38755 / EP155) TaxID=660469 RepID=A0A9P5CNE7_CRYP1|nr:MFS general substrate transporter [Cryphonectria parasitica EP155]KAF3764061.1 MFS general substrate transporter [Cryphonectria parasitica EP155]
MVVFVGAMDTVAMTVALPSITHDFHGSNSLYAWIPSSYLLAQCVTVPIWGRFSDVWGRKPLLLAASALAFVASLVTALAINSPMLVVARTLHGVGTGGSLVLANICVADLYDFKRRAKYLGLLGAVWATAVAFAPLIAGALNQRLSWRWIFWINLPCIAAAFLSIALCLQTKNKKVPFVAGVRTIDWPGIALISAGATLFLVGLQSGGTMTPWSSALPITLIVLGTLCLIAFGLVQWRVSARPLVPPSIFTQRSNAAALLVCFCQSLAFIATAFYIPLYFQAILGATSLQSGIWFLPLAIPFSVFCVGTGAFIKRTGHYVSVIRIGLAAMTLGCALFTTFADVQDWWRIVCFQIIAAVGIGLNFYAPLLALQAHLEPAVVAAGTSAFQFVRMLANSVSLVIGQSILQNALGSQSGALRAAGIPDALISHLSGGDTVSVAEEITTGQTWGLSAAQAASVLSAVNFGFQRMWIFYAAVSGFALLSSMAISHAKQPKPAPPATT